MTNRPTQDTGLPRVDIGKDEVINPESRIKLHSSESSRIKIGNTENQDAAVNDPEHRLFAVFDGMGGENGGAAASGIGKDFLARIGAQIPDEIDPAEALNKLKSIFVDANNEMIRLGEINPELHGMGTTASAVKLVSWQGRDYAVLVNVGDSRIYGYRDDKLTKFTVDAGNANQEEQVILDEASSKEELLKQPNGQRLLALFYRRNQIAEPLGHLEKSPEGRVIEITQSGKILITSDGIHDNLTTSEVAKLMSDPNVTADKLVEAAYKRSKTHDFRNKGDDLTAIVVDIEKKPSSESSVILETPEIFNMSDQVRHASDSLAHIQALFLGTADMVKTTPGSPLIDVNIETITQKIVEFRNHKYLAPNVIRQQTLDADFWANELKKLQDQLESTRAKNVTPVATSAPEVKELELRQMAEQLLDEELEAELNGLGMTPEEKTEERAKKFYIRMREAQLIKLMEQFRK